MCEHLDGLDGRTAGVRPSSPGCKECLETGGRWVHLRLCLTCGHVGCCDSSPARHASRHFHATSHPVVKSFEPGEEWAWCYADEEMVEAIDAFPEESPEVHYAPGAERMTAARHAAHGWPELPLAPWRGTRDTLHMWTQIVGKTLLALAPPQNHWWHSALRVTASGLATPAPMLDGERSLDVELDLVRHVLTARSDGASRTMPLEPRTVRAFYLDYMALLRELGIDVHIWTTPVEVPDPIPFDRDVVHREYDREAAHRFWQVLRRSDAALRALSGGYVGKQSPVHFFWGSFDLAATRFSGRPAPERPGADPVTREAYSHEVISFGFWPGGTTQAGASVDEPIFYAYAAPEPAGFRDARVVPAAARYDEALGEYVLPYAAARAADDPAREVRAFCESVYRAGSTLGAWDRGALERSPAPRAAHDADEHGGVHPAI